MFHACCVSELLVGGAIIEMISHPPILSSLPGRDWAPESWAHFPRCHSSNRRSWRRTWHCIPLRWWAPRAEWRTSIGAAPKAAARQRKPAAAPATTRTAQKQSPTTPLRRGCCHAVISPEACDDPNYQKLFDLLSFFQNPGRRIHSISIHGFTKIQNYPHGYPWFLYVSLLLSIQVLISTFISKQGYPCKDILQWISVKHKYQWMDTHLWISVFNYSCFYGYPWISMDIHAWTCYGFSIQGIVFLNCSKCLLLKNTQNVEHQLFQNSGVSL